MVKVGFALRCCVLISVALVAGCSSDGGAASAQAPAAPVMPTGWSVTSDETFESADIQPVSRSLGGEVISLRDTLYTVSGKPVKLNTIVTASSKDADKIMFKLRKMKPDDFTLRQGVTIYEFVGTNDVIPDMRAGKAHLAARLGS